MAKAETTTTAPPDPRRALTLDQVLGNEPVRRFLREAWRAGRLPQSLLLAGAVGLGKTTMAWALAREIVSEGGDPATHPRAGKIERNVHPDIFDLTVQEDSRSQQIKIDQVHKLEDWVATAPLESPRKIVMIEPAEGMNDSSANCVLKILEEPPSHLLFVLISPEPNRLLDTIRSRCTIMRLEPVPVDELAAWLRKKARLDEDKARLVALLAEGRPGLALGLAKAGMLELRGEILDSMSLLMKYGFAGVFAVAGRLLAVKAGLAEALTVAMTLMRDALVLKARGAGILNVDLADRLEEFARERSMEGLLEAGRLFERATAEAPFFYSAQAKAQFVECLITDVGRVLR